MHDVIREWLLREMIFLIRNILKIEILYFIQLIIIFRNFSKKCILHFHTFGHIQMYDMEIKFSYLNLASYAKNDGMFEYIYLF